LTGRRTSSYNSRARRSETLVSFWEAWRKVREKNGAPGIDGETVDDFERNLERNLLCMTEQFERDCYKPSPFKRVPIPKDEMMEKNIPVHFIDLGGRYKGSVTSGRGRGYAIRRLQMNAASDENASLRIACSIVSGKLENQFKTLLRARNRGRMDDAALKNACGELKYIHGELMNCSDIDSVRGYEGEAAAVYFSVFGRLLRNSWAFRGRNRRPPKDAINAMLSFGYTLLLSHVTSAVVISGLDPCVGFLHPEHRGRPSLALDIMEEYRSQIVDRLVIAIANQLLLKPEDFIPTGDGGVFMTPEARKSFIQHYLKRLNSSVRNERTGVSSTFRSHIYSSAAAFVSSLRAGDEYMPFQASM
jgi:CRISPR-associated protein Cas1